MPSLSVLRTLIRELFTLERSPRINEPDLVMDDPEKVAAYSRAGREDGVMAPVYLFHCAQICELIKPGDTIVDLGCGPATQLAMAARLNPNSNFIGVDLSSEMLDIAEQYIAEQSLGNVSFRESDISKLECFENSSVDVVFSTVALHHLPDADALGRTFSEVNRILKPNGCIYLVDFGHLKSEKSIASFARQYAGVQAELFTLDYLYSLRAAFSLRDFKSLARKYLGKHVEVKSTFGMPFMVAIKSQKRISEPKQDLIDRLHQIRDDLPPNHRVDLSDLISFFAMGGLASPLLK